MCYGHAFFSIVLHFPGRFPQTMSPAKLIFPGSTAGTVAQYRILQEDTLSLDLGLRKYPGREL